MEEGVKRELERGEGGVQRSKKRRKKEKRRGGKKRRIILNIFLGMASKSEKEIGGGGY